MSDCNKKLSGFQKRKRNKEKFEKEKELLRNVPKLNTFFISTTSRPSSSSSPSTNSTSALASGSCSDADDRQQATPTNVSDCNELPENIISENPVTVTKNDSLENPASKPHADTYFAIPSSLSDDPAEWMLDEVTLEYLIQNGVKLNIDADFSSSRRQYADKTRYLSLSLFSRTLSNGETRPRPWLIFSKSKGAVFCAPCKMFRKLGSLANEGYNDWKNAVQRMKEHENADEHRSALATLLGRKNAGGRVDKSLVLQTEEEIKYWHEVLRRIVVVVRSLSARGLPFRGSHERFESKNSGNYVMTLELLAEFDPFLDLHIKRHGNKGSGTTSYLSSKICDEMINIMAEKVINTIVTEIKHAKYFSISVDSTPDISHVDQLSFIVRYVSEDGCPVERFLKFIPNCGHKAEDLAKVVLETLKNHDLDIADCRGQSYDNASNMSGVYSGLQARMKQGNPLIDFVPCSAHSLNLVGSCAAESCQAAVSFFGILQSLYNFFSASTHRWKILQSKLKSNSTVVKSLSRTRWSARADACRSLCCSWDEIMAALQIIGNDANEKPSTRSEASGLLNSLDSTETCFLSFLWNDILERFNKVSKSLQSVNIDLGTIVELYLSLITYLEDLRKPSTFDHYESQVIEKTGENNYAHDMQRKRKRKVQFDEVRGNETELSGRDRFRVTIFNVIIDRLITELRRRGSAYQELSKKFGFLTKLHRLESKDIREGARNLITFYPGDLDRTLENECLHLQAHLSSNDEVTELSSLKLYKYLSEKGFLDIYPNVGIALRMLLCTPASNCSAERSFSALKRVKNYLRSNIGENRLNSLSLMYIESEIMQSIDYDDVIRSFAEKKVRRMIL